MGKRIAIIVTAILIIDQLVKIWVKSGLFGFDAMYQNQSIPVIANFFNIYYVENPGMAFGTTLGSGVWAKYALSIFRLIAIAAIAVYVVRLLRDPAVHKGLIYAMALIFAGATGNLIDGMCYDYVFDINPDHRWNWIEDENGALITGDGGVPVLRQTGFLLGNVVDMFQFTSKWPSYFPVGMSGEEIFGAIWNVADASISTGVGLIILRYRTYFRKVAVVISETGEPLPGTVQVGVQPISVSRWIVYFVLSIIVFFGCLFGGSHLWKMATGSVDPGIISLLSLLVGYLSFWAMRDYIKTGNAGQPLR